MARKVSENKTGVSEKAEAVDVKTAAAAQAETATENDKQTSADSAIENTGGTGVDNATVTAGSAAEVKAADSEAGGTSGETEDSSDGAGGTSGETEDSSDGADGNPDATDDETGETDGAYDDEDGDPEKVKQEPKTGTGFKFNVSSDGFVEVISEKRAGKSVTGATGEIITFDDKGYAKVKLEDAVHFSQVPGFSFK